jgi:hypothetical protein
MYVANSAVTLVFFDISMNLNEGSQLPFEVHRQSKRNDFSVKWFSYHPFLKFAIKRHIDFAGK